MSSGLSESLAARFRVHRIPTLGALAVIIALAGCGGDSTPKSTSTAASSTTTTPSSTTTTITTTPDSTTTAPSSTTTIPSETTEAATDFDIRVNADTEWGDVFDALTTSEQDCIRDTFGGDILESVLDRSVMSGTEAWEILMFSCLAPQTARAVYLSSIIAEIEEEMVFEIDADMEACLAEWVAGLDVVATMAALSVDNAEATGRIATAFMTCIPDLVVSLMLEETGLTLEDLNEEEATCLRQWVTDTDWAPLLGYATDDPSVLMVFVPDLIACAPDLFLSAMIEDTGITLEDLNEEEASCLRTWVTDTDWTTLPTGSTDDPSLLFDFLPGLFDCVPDLFLSAFLEETGITLEDLTEDEASCLRTWVTDTDWATLLGSTDDPSLLVDISPDLSYCVPDLWWSEPSDRPWDEMIDEATPVEIGVSTQGEVNYEGDSDFFTFEATEGEFYDLEVTLGTLQDSVLDLYNADGTWLASNDNYGGDSPASRLIWNAPSTDTHYVRVTGFEIVTGTYTLAIAVSGIPDDYPNSPDNATPVELGEITQGELEHADDTDFLAFEAIEGETYYLDLTFGTLQDSVLNLYDADGTWLPGYPDYDDSAFRLTWQAPTTGTYYVNVASFVFATGTYTLTIALSGIVDDHRNWATGATPIEVGVATQGELEYEGDVDSFTFEATDGETHYLDVTPGTLQSFGLGIFDADDNWLDGNDNYFDPTTTRLTWQAPSTGTYYVNVNNVADFGFGTTGTYTLTISTDDHPNSAENATPVETGVDTQGNLNYEGDEDFFAFQAEEGETYYLDLTLGTLQHSVLYIYDADGAWLNGDYGLDKDSVSQIKWQALSTATYYVLVAGFDTSTGAYTLTISTDDHPNSAQDATLVDIGEDTQGDLDYEGDIDYFAFQAEEGEYYELDVTLGTLQHPALYVYYTDRDELVYYTSFGRDSAYRLTWQAPSTDIYFLLVAAFDARSTGTYTLTITPSQAART